MTEKRKCMSLIQRRLNKFREALFSYTGHDDQISEIACLEVELVDAIKTSLDSACEGIRKEVQK